MTPSTEPNALTAAWKPLSKAFLSAKAKAQLRDNKGRFIKMNSLVRWKNDDGTGYNHGKVTGTPTAGSKTVEVTPDGNGAPVALKPKQLEVIKAVLPEPGSPAPTAPAAKKIDNVGINYSAGTPDVDEPDSDLYLDSDGFQKVGNQAGSNVGGFYQDPDSGEQYYIKRADDEEHALNEVLASRLYRESGIQVPDVFITDMADEPAVASKVVADVKQLFNGKPKSGESDKITKATDGFAVDAWLANWDVVGLTYDNLLQTPDGEPIRIDTGGSLLYRAQGAPKGNLFGDAVGEVDTFRDPSMNPQSYSVFGNVTDEQVAESVRAHVLPVTPERIDALVDSLPTDDEDFKQGLKDRLKARRQNLLDRFNVTEAPAAVDEPAAEVETSATPEVAPPGPNLVSVTDPSTLKKGDKLTTRDGDAITLTDSAYSNTGAKWRVPFTNDETGKKSIRVFDEDESFFWRPGEATVEPAAPEVPTGPPVKYVKQDLQASDLQPGDNLGTNPEDTDRIIAKVDSFAAGNGRRVTFTSGKKVDFAAGTYLSRWIPEESNDDGANSNTPDGVDSDGAGAPEAPAGAPDLDGGPGDGDAATEQEAVDTAPTINVLANASSKQKSALKTYTGVSYKAFNNYLRTGELPSGGATSADYSDWSKNLDQLLTKAEIAETGVVYRGVAKPTKVFGSEALQPGTIISDKAYLSTSVDRTTARSFGGNDGALFEIEVPKGTPVIDANASGSVSKSEQEYVFGRNSNLEIVSDEVDDKGQRVIRAKLVPASQLPNADEPSSLDAADESTDESIEAPQGDYLSEEINTFVAELDKLGTLSPALAQDIDFFSANQTLDSMNELEETLRSGLYDLPNTQRMAVLDLFNEFRGGPNGEGWPFDGAGFSVNKSAVIDTPAFTEVSISQPDVTPDEEMAVDAYGGDAYQSINGTLRSGEFVPFKELDEDEWNQEILDEAVATLDNLMSRSFLTEDAVLYRGVNPKKNGWPPANFEPGTTISDLGYLSTSPQLETAYGFSNTSDQPGLVFKIDVPKGSNAISVAKASSENTFDEDEYLLPRGSSIEIIEDGVNLDGIRVVHARLVPAPIDAPVLEDELPEVDDTEVMFVRPASTSFASKLSDLNAMSSGLEEALIDYDANPTVSNFETLDDEVQELAAVLPNTSRASLLEAFAAFRSEMLGGSNVEEPVTAEEVDFSLPDAPTETVTLVNLKPGDVVKVDGALGTSWAEVISSKNTTGVRLRQLTGPDAGKEFFRPKSGTNAYPRATTDPEGLQGVREQLAAQSPNGFLVSDALAPDLQVGDIVVSNSMFGGTTYSQVTQAYDPATGKLGLRKLDASNEQTLATATPVYNYKRVTVGVPESAEPYVQKQQALDDAVHVDGVTNTAAPATGTTSKKAVTDLAVGDVVRRTSADGSTHDYEVTSPYGENGVLELTPLESPGGLNNQPQPQKQVYGPNATLDVVDPDPASLPEDVETPDATPVPSTGGEAVDLAPQVPGKKIYSVPVQHDGPAHVQVGAQVTSVKGDLNGTVVKVNPSAGYALVDDGAGKQLWRQWGTLTPATAADPTVAEVDADAPALAPQVAGKKIYSIAVQHDGPAHVQPGAQVVSSKDGLKGTITKVNAVDGYALVDNGEGKSYWRQWNTLSLDETTSNDSDVVAVESTPTKPLSPSEAEQVVPSTAPLPPEVPEHAAIGKFVVSKKDGFSGVVLKHNLKVLEALVQREDGKKLWRRFNTLDPLPETETDNTPDEQAVLDALASNDSAANNTGLLNAPSAQLDADVNDFASSLAADLLYSDKLDDALDILAKDPSADNIASFDDAVEERASELGPISAGKLRAHWEDFKKAHGWSAEDESSSSDQYSGTEALADWEKELLGLKFDDADLPEATPKTEHPITFGKDEYSPDEANQERDALVEVFQDLDLDTDVEDYLADFYSDRDQATLDALINHVTEIADQHDPADQLAFQTALNDFVNASTPGKNGNPLNQFVANLNDHFAFSATTSTSLSDALINQYENKDQDSLDHLDDTVDQAAAELDPEQGQNLLKLWDGLKTANGWQVSAPDEPIAAADYSTPLEDPSTLNGTPVAGSAYLLEDAQGRYYVSKNGHVLRKGTQVVSDKDGFAGEVIYLEKQVKYAKVKSADGTVKLRQLDTLTPQGAAPELEKDAPAAVLPETSGKKLASSLAPGDTVLTPLGEQVTVAKVEENVFDDGSVLVTYSGFEGYPVEMLKDNELTLAVASQETAKVDLPLMQQALKKFDELPASQLEPGMKIGSHYGDSLLTVGSVEKLPDGNLNVKFLNNNVPYTMNPNTPFNQVWAGDPDFTANNEVAPTATPVGTKLAEYLKPGDLVQTPNGSWKQVVNAYNDPYSPNQAVIIEYLGANGTQKLAADSKVTYQESTLPDQWLVEDLVPNAKVYYGGKLHTVDSVNTNDDGDYLVKFKGMSYPVGMFSSDSLYSESTADKLNAALPKPELVPGKELVVNLPNGNPVNLPAGAQVNEYGGDYSVQDAFGVKYSINPDGTLTPGTKESGEYYSMQYGSYTELKNENPVGQITPNLGAALALKDGAAAKLKGSIGYQSNAQVRKALEKLYDGDFNGDSLSDDEWSALALGPVSYGDSGDSLVDGAVRAEIMKMVKTHTGSYSGEWKRRTSYDTGLNFLFTQTERKALASVGLSSGDLDQVNSKSFDPRDMPQVSARINAVVDDPELSKLLDELFGTGTSNSIKNRLRGPGYTPGLSGRLSPFAPAAPERPTAQIIGGERAGLGDFVSAVKDNAAGRVVLVTPDGKFRVQRSDGSTFTRKANGFKRVVAEQAVSVAPAKAVFLKSRVEFTESDWSTPVGSTLTPNTALERIRTDVPSAVRGASIAVDDDQIEDLNVGITRLRGQNGEELIELKFKLTPPAGKTWKKRVELESWTKSNMAVKSRYQLSKNELPVLGNDYQSSHGKTFKKQTEQGAEILFHVADNEAVGSSAPLSMHNLVQIYLPADASEADIQRALYEAGVDRPGMTTKETARTFVENRMLSLFGGYGNPFKKPTGDERAAKLKQVETTWGFTADDVDFVEGTQGRVELRIPDAVVEKLMARSEQYNGKRVKYLQHSVHGGDLDMVKIAAGPHHAALGAIARKTEGIVDNSTHDSSGMSADDDVQYGSGQYIYTSPVQELSGYGNLVFPPQAMLKKFNFWMNKNDNYGKRVAGEVPVDNFYPGSHEVMVKNSLDLEEAYGYTVYDQVAKDKLIKKMHDAGVQSIGGRSVEDFIILVGDFYSSSYKPAELSAPPGLLSDQTVPVTTGVTP